MRRLLAYSLLASGIIIASAAAFTPTLTSMDTDISYGYGRDLVFKISEHREENYNGIDPADPDSYISDDNYTAVNLVAEEMSERLEHWGVTDYTLTKEGYDTIRVRLRTENNTDTEYEYLEFYLPFSGGSISVDASMDEEDDYAYSTSWADMFTGQEATIEYIQNDTIPVVVIPVNYEGEDGELGQLIDYCNSKHRDADTSASIEEQNCYVVLWSHKQETDFFAAATGQGMDVDANVANRFLGASNAANVWFEESNEDDNYTRFQYIPSTAAINGAGEFDDDQALAAYKGAFFYMSLFNASDYADLGIGYDVTFSFSTAATPEVEGLIEHGFSLYPAMSNTMIALLVSLGITIIILALFYRMGSLAAIASIGVSLIGTMLFIAYFHAQLGAGMVLGLALVILLSIFGSVYYMAKLKNEIYQGRSLKKAHEEAAKKAFWPTLDAGILYVVIGLAVYFLIPAQGSMAGLAMVIGGLVATISSLLLTRVLMWIYAGDADAANKVDKQLGIDKSKVPDLLKEEKPSYNGLFAKSNFMKPWKGVAIASSVLLLGAIATLATFSVLDNGQPFNNSGSTTNSIAYVTYRTMEGATNDSLNGIDDIDNGSNGLLNIVYLGEDSLAEAGVVDSISMQTTSVTLTNGQVEEGVYTTYNFMINFNEVYDDTTEYDFRVINGTTTENFTTLEEALTRGLEIKNIDETSFTVSVKGVSNENLAPSFNDVCLGLGISLVCALVYLSVRYRLSRGITITVLSGGAAFIALGILSATRLIASPVAAIGSVAVLAISLLLALFILGKEKEIVAESHERDKSTLEFRATSLLAANSQGAAEYILYGIMAAYVFVCFLAFGASEFALINALALVGILIAMAMIIILIVPSSLFLAKQISKIHLDLSWRKKKTTTTRKTSEPEEAIFIGIND